MDPEPHGREDRHAKKCSRRRPHSDLTRSILESAMRVQSALGVGLCEKPHKACLAHALRQEGHRVLMEVKLDITFAGLLVPESYRMIRK